ncbi:unnamed protein product, partial [marine sediment metagenome]
EYLRPQMVRKEWTNLNGLWDYAIRPAEEKALEVFDGKILVPFAIESALSGVGKEVGETQAVWYRRTFDLPSLTENRRLLLHFGAVDWHATVWVNSTQVGEHRGGYDPFTLDITGALGDSGQEIVIRVWDPTDAGYQARGKQLREPNGIWYTAVTGIWQTVWLEAVPNSSIDGLKIEPDVDQEKLCLKVQGRNAKEGDTIEAIALEDGKTVASVTGVVGSELELTIDQPRLWSPDSPFLYDLHVSLLRDGQMVDRVESYFGMRKISVAKDDRGV